ncbi:MAG: hypothetical protein ACK5JM_00640 [Rhodoblastus sp.]
MTFRIRHSLRRTRKKHGGLEPEDVILQFWRTLEQRVQHAHTQTWRASKHSSGR